MPADLTWLVGKRLREVAKKDYSWFFWFAAGGTIVTESDWRLVTNKGIEVASEDHGQLFGLKEPVDASARVAVAVKEKEVVAFRIADRTSDLSLTFEGEVYLEFLNLSCGYESWRAQHGVAEVICMGGGQLAFFHDGKNG
jgi:hypothetical protein